MKAALHTRYGPPQVVSIGETPAPVPKEDEVLIGIRAATVNRTDCGFRSAEYFVSRFFSGLFRPKNPVLGNEFAGVVEEVGKDVTMFSRGDRVFGYNDTKFGSHAEYKVEKETGAIALIPPGFSFEEAAPLSEGAHYALCIIRAAKVKKEQNVLVYGATGAIGSAGVQLLKHFGARVTAVCNTKNMELVRSLGADKVVDYTKEDFTRTDERYDFIFDAVGKSSFSRCKPLLGKKGVYISTEPGTRGANIFLALLTPLFGGRRVLFPLPVTRREDILFLKELAEKGEYKPVIDRTYSLNDIVEAHRYVETGQKTGNVVIRVSP